MSWQRQSPPRRGHLVEVTHQGRVASVVLDGAHLVLAPGYGIDLGDPDEDGLVPVTITVRASRLALNVLPATATEAPAASSPAPPTPSPQEH